MEKKTKEVAVIDKRIKSYELTQPEQLVQMSVILKQHIVSQKLFTNIQGKNYVHVEGWQFAGGMMGTLPRIVRVEKTDNGSWLAEAEIVQIITQKIISRGFALCSEKETKGTKKVRTDDYAVISMAQTRAIGKAYRNVIGWVMKLSGYESTPREEMQGTETPITIPQGNAPKIEAECHSCGNPITIAEKNYSIKLYKKQLCRTCQPKSSKK